MNKTQFLSSVASKSKKYPIGSQENVKDPLFCLKLFDIAGSGTWYISEYNPETHL